MSAPDERPVSVAELLARNGTIGSPPVGGRRRRRGRRNSDGVSVAELTGEIPVIRTGEIPVVEAEEPDSLDVVYEEADYAGPAYEEAVYGEPAYEEAVYEEPAYESVSAETVYEEPVTDRSEYPAASVVYAVPADVESTPTGATAPPLSRIPVPRRSGGPELSHDPRPLRRSSGAEQMAEQMAYDPVDESVNLADLVDEPAGDVEELRSYLRASTDTLFSGGTVADDLARRGIAVESDEEYDEEFDDARLDGAVSTAVSARPRGFVGTLWGSAVAVLQSLVAVVFGAGLFIGFDQLWRRNNLVALILSVLVVLTLAAVVRFVRKTEDIVSTLTAVAVGLLVTLGPLALQST
jgi:hypothetical protein